MIQQRSAYDGVDYMEHPEYGTRHTSVFYCTTILVLSCQCLASVRLRERGGLLQGSRSTITSYDIRSRSKAPHRQSVPAIGLMGLIGEKDARKPIMPMIATLDIIRGITKYALCQSTIWHPCRCHDPSLNTRTSTYFYPRKALSAFIHIVVVQLLWL